MKARLSAAYKAKLSSLMLSVTLLVASLTFSGFASESRLNLQRSTQTEVIHSTKTTDRTAHFQCLVQSVNFKSSYLPPSQYVLASAKHGQILNIKYKSYSAHLIISQDQIELPKYAPRSSITVLFIG